MPFASSVVLLAAFVGLLSACQVTVTPNTPDASPAPSASPSPPLAGGYVSQDPAAAENQPVRVAAEQALQAKYPDANLRLTRMTQLETQVVAGLNYRMTADYTSSSGDGQITLVLYRNLQGEYSLSSDNYTP
ncbi:MAG: hypothetical protein ACO1RX_19005 [Candidatus Sericytochromatia bacterium]